jgi:uncharacterized protein YbjT (DUF2867 family)
MPCSILIAGVTGLVGREVFACAIGSSRVSDVTAIVRRPLPASDMRGRILVADFGALDAHPPVPCTHAVCALGTTIARAGSQSAFRSVDFDVVVAVARLARRGGATRFGLVSSAGANAQASNFYLKVKGETEEALGRIGFDGLYLLRLGLLLGQREESRPTEAMFRAVAPALNAVMVGPLRRYRSISARDVATGLLGAVLDGAPGTHVLHYDEILRAGHFRSCNAPSP